jgi:hypothetical protein
MEPSQKKSFPQFKVIGKNEPVGLVELLNVILNLRSGDTMTAAQEKSWRNWDSMMKQQIGEENREDLEYFFEKPRASAKKLFDLAAQNRADESRPESHDEEAPEEGVTKKSTEKETAAAQTKENSVHRRTAFLRKTPQTNKKESTSGSESGSKNGSSSSDSESTTNHEDKVATSDDPSEKEDEPDESLTESHDEEAPKEEVTKKTTEKETAKAQTKKRILVIEGRLLKRLTMLSVMRMRTNRVIWEESQKEVWVR